MENFSFSDYLKLLETFLIGQTDSLKTDRAKREIELLSSHEANAQIMSKHLRFYKMLKDLQISFGLEL